jgi:hypothetical protein
MNLTENPKYMPNHLLDKVMEMFELDTDKALAHRLKVHPTSISKVRRREIVLGDVMLLALHDLTGLPAKELRKWGGMG